MARKCSDLPSIAPPPGPIRSLARAFRKTRASPPRDRDAFWLKLPSPGKSTAATHPRPRPSQPANDLDADKAPTDFLARTFYRYIGSMRSGHWLAARREKCWWKLLRPFVELRM